MTTSERLLVEATVKAYVEGYLGQDAPTLRKAFHPDSVLMSVDGGIAEGGATAAWFDRIETKRANGGGPLQGRYEILSIDQTGIAAVAKVRLDLPTTTFTDYLSLLKADSGWQIVHKIYDSSQ